MAGVDSRGDALEDRLLENNALFLKKLVAKLFPFVLAFLYAFFLTSLPLEEFKDRANYLEYAKHSELIFAVQASGGVVAMLANEPLWLLVNIGLSQFLTAEEILRVIIFFPAFGICFLLLRSNPAHIGWMLFFLLIPQVIKNHIIHLRQGLGIAIFLIGYYSKSRWIRFPLMLSTGFIHSSFFIINLIGVFAWASGKARLSSGLRISILLAAFVSIGVLLDVLAAGLGARQGTQYADAGLDVSGLGFLMWGTVLLIFLSSKTSYLIRQVFPLSILVFYISAYFLSPVSARIFESGILLVFLAGLALSGWRRQAFLAVTVVYTLLMYATRLGQPGLGWGGI